RPLQRPQRYLCDRLRHLRCGLRANYASGRDVLASWSPEHGSPHLTLTARISIVDKAFPKEHRMKFDSVESAIADIRNGCMVILPATDAKTKPSDLARPGHVFPLRADKGGVLKRAGQTEGSVDLARLAGLYPAGVLCEIMNDDGTMARVPQLHEIAKRHHLRLVTIKDLI